MNIVLVHFIGIQGATIATVICSYIIYMVRKIAVGKEIKIDYYAVVLITWGMLSIQAIVESYLANYLIEVVIMVFLLIINLKLIRQLLLNGKSILVLLKKKN